MGAVRINAGRLWSLQCIDMSRVSDELDIIMELLDLPMR